MPGVEVQVAAAFARSINPFVLEDSIMADVLDMSHLWLDDSCGHWQAAEAMWTCSVLSSFAQLHGSQILICEMVTAQPYIRALVPQVSHAFSGLRFYGMAENGNESYGSSQC